MLNDSIEPNLTNAAQRTNVHKSMPLKVTDEVNVSVLQLYKDFRKRFPQVTQAADVRHIKVWGSVDDEIAFCWFESLAGAINDQMGTPKEAIDLNSIFSFFETQLLDSDIEVKNCIDVSLVENLFWEVPPSSAASAWHALPNSMQQLYLSFHGQPPTKG